MVEDFTPSSPKEKRSVGFKISRANSVEEPTYLSSFGKAVKSTI